MRGQERSVTRPFVVPTSRASPRDRWPPPLEEVTPLAGMVATGCGPLQAHSKAAINGVTSVNFAIMVNPSNHPNSRVSRHKQRWSKQYSSIRQVSLEEFKLLVADGCLGGARSVLSAGHCSSDRKTSDCVDAEHDIVRRVTPRQSRQGGA